MKKTTQKNDLQPADSKRITRKTLLISNETKKTLEDYVQKKRINGDLFYSQSRLIREAIEAFITR